MFLLIKMGLFLLKTEISIKKSSPNKTESFVMSNFDLKPTFKTVLTKKFYTKFETFTIYFIARKTIFSNSWNIMESSKRSSKYHLSINFLAERKSVFPITKKFKTNFFSAVIKHYISINFLAQKMTVFSISEKFKTRPY